MSFNGESFDSDKLFKLELIFLMVLLHYCLLLIRIYTL